MVSVKCSTFAALNKGIKMAKSKMTQRWEKIKHQYDKCLCYSKQKGLYTRTFIEGEHEDDILYRPHGFMGYVSDLVDIPEMNLQITINSNFGYGRREYHFAVIQYKGKNILNFDQAYIYVLNRCSVANFSVPIYDWNALFDKIIAGSKLATSDKYKTSAITYIDELANMFDKPQINVRSYLCDNNPTQWKGEFLITLHSGQKIKNLLDGFNLAAPPEFIIRGQLMELCRKYLKKVSSQTFDITDKRMSQLSEVLLAIHQFMCQNKAGLEYLEYIFQIKIKK